MWQIHTSIWVLIQYSVLKNIWEKKIPKYTLMEDIKSEEITKKKKKSVKCDFNK